ncbi:isoprenylcysteine carboxylmethyltransferase family protein [Hydrogenophaga aromaticivorans]|uniref:methyltransferase family protein n=1 Tax=Hydrogenophaga aromaticivorans TaxID=2610898 RepID=UPI001B37EEBC|nr:isoprenylcysteine carboxylmethyltransferase family protein [Hydrogenophaga aromaticivorans]MBQ0921907.1 isoprenylcysteine carboxylmethyltransferase family protein [Hydrogenophaga aromaticivorans]
MNALELKIPPPVVALLLALAMWALVALGPALPWPEGIRRVVALVLALVGASFDFMGLVAFLRRHTTINPLRPANASALVTSGIYRVTRNPMYVGLVCFLTAWAVWLGAWLAFAGPVVFVLYITRFQIQPEERVLTTLFGDTYTAYTRRVRRWL